VRLFVAVELEPELRDEFAALQGQLRDVQHPGVWRWSDLRRMHLTLVFLGEVAPARVEAISGRDTAVSATCDFGAATRSSQAAGTHRPSGNAAAGSAHETAAACSTRPVSQRADTDRAALRGPPAVGVAAGRNARDYGVRKSGGDCGLAPYSCLTSLQDTGVTAVTGS
jgi:hypothetical protein